MEPTRIQIVTGLSMVALSIALAFLGLAIDFILMAVVALTAGPEAYLVLRRAFVSPIFFTALELIEPEHNPMARYLEYHNEDSSLQEARHILESVTYV